MKIKSQATIDNIDSSSSTIRPYRKFGSVVMEGDSEKALIDHNYQKLLSKEDVSEKYELLQDQMDLEVNQQSKIIVLNTNDFSDVLSGLMSINAKKRTNLSQLNSRETNLLAQESLQSTITPQDPSVSQEIEMQNKIYQEADLTIFLQQKLADNQFKIKRIEKFIQKLKLTINNRIQMEHFRNSINRSKRMTASNPTIISSNMKYISMKKIRTNRKYSNNQMKPQKSKNKKFSKQQFNQHLSKLLQNEYAYDEKVLQKQEFLIQQTSIIENEEQAIIKKFYLIQRCAEFLDELDDFDKLALIFIYDDPKNFNLIEIQNVVQIQLKKPRELYQKQSLDEFIQRLKFNQVSIRMNLFLRFHGGSLQNVVKQLILMYKQQKSQETMHSYKYQDLLDQQNALSAYDKQLSEMLISSQNKCLQELNEKSPDVQDYKQDYIIRYFSLYFSRSDKFMDKILNFLVQTLIRFFNTVQQISDILKSCRKEDFNPRLYVRIIYTKLFEIIKKEQISKQLEQEFSVKFFNENSKTRHSNKILNTILDQLELKMFINIIESKRKRMTKKKPFYLLPKLKKPLLNFHIQKSNKLLILLNKIHYFGNISILTYTLFSLIKLQKLSHIWKTSIQLIFYNNLKSKPEQPKSILLRKNRRFYLIKFMNFLIAQNQASIKPYQTRLIKSQTWKKNLQRQQILIHLTFTQIIEQSNFKYEIKNQRRSSIDLKISEMQLYQGISKEIPFEPKQTFQEEKQTFQIENQKIRVSRLGNNELKIMGETLEKIDKDLFQISQTKKINKQNSLAKGIDIYNVPIFNYLHTRHLKTRKSLKDQKKNQSQNTENGIIEDFETPLRRQSNQIVSRKSLIKSVSTPKLAKIEPEKIITKQLKPGNNYFFDSQKSKYYLKIQEKNNRVKDISNQTQKLFTDNQINKKNDKLKSSSSNYSFLNWMNQRKQLKFKITTIQSQSKVSMQLTRVTDTNRDDIE